MVESYWSPIPLRNKFSSWYFVRFPFPSFSLPLSGRYFFPGKTKFPAAILSFSGKIVNHRIGYHHYVTILILNLVFSYRLASILRLCLGLGIYQIAVSDWAVGIRVFSTIKRYRLYIFCYLLIYLSFYLCCSILNLFFCASLFSVLKGQMASRRGSSRKSMSFSNSSVGGKKKTENGGPDTTRRMFSASRTV